MPSAHKSVRIAKISILKLEGIIKKISYERRDYESVDENSLSEALSRKTTKNYKLLFCHLFTYFEIIIAEHEQYKVFIYIYIYIYIFSYNN